MDAAAEFEEEQRIRMEEIHFLQNICSGLPDESAQNQMRRTMVVMLYSHFEGFAKFAFELYRRAVENSNLKCCDVQPALATAALKDIFKAFRNPDGAQNFLPKGLKDLTDLKTLAIESAFVENAWEFGQRPISLRGNFVDTESNLKPIVLRKNLYRLGLPHDLFDEFSGSVDKLLKYRNAIAHGSFLKGIDEAVYNELYEMVKHVMNGLKDTILDAIKREAFRRSVTKAA